MAGTAAGLASSNKRLGVADLRDLDKALFPGCVYTPAGPVLYIELHTAKTAVVLLKLNYMPAAAVLVSRSC